MSRTDSSKSYRSGLYLVFFLGTTALLLSGCAGRRQAGTGRMIPAEMTVTERDKCRGLEKENERLKQTLTKQGDNLQDLERKIAALELRLMKEKIQMKEPIEREALQQKKLEEAVQEVVRAEAKLRSLESKAEAASNLAEAEVALKDLKARAADQNKYPEVIQAEHMLRMSVQEFQQGNYGGALYLTNQAKRFVKMGQERLMRQEKQPTDSAPVPFVVPLRLKVLKKSNVREGPGFDFKVLFTLEKGSAVIGHSYKDEWIRAKSEDNRDGWIFYSLVDRW